MHICRFNLTTYSYTYMELTLLLTQILGVYMVIGGLSGIFYPARMQKALSEMTRSYILPYFDGALALLVGLLIVLNHNLWSSANEIIISLFGWIAVIEGTVLMLLPHNFIMGFLKRMYTKQFLMGWSILAIIIGAYLTYLGFLI